MSGAPDEGSSQTTTTRTTPQCIATAKGSGERCKRCPIPGGTVCVKHGGGAPHVRAAAARRLAEAKAAAKLARFGEPVEVHPIEALLDLVHWTAGLVAYWRSQVAIIEASQGLDGLTWGVTKVERGTDRGERKNVKTREARPHIAYVMLERASDQLAAYASAALRAGVDERRVQLAERQGDLVASVIRSVLDRLDLSAAQWDLVPVVVPEQLRLLTDGAPPLAGRSGPLAGVGRRGDSQVIPAPDRPGDGL